VLSRQFRTRVFVAFLFRGGVGVFVGVFAILLCAERGFVVVDLW
jgi:hypothetical protein